MTVAKPLAMLLAYAVAAPRRAALLGLLAATAVAFTGPGPQPVGPDGQAPLTAIAVSPPASGALPGPDFGWFAHTPVRGDWSAVADFSGSSTVPAAVVALLLVVVFAVWWAGRVTRRLGRGLARWLPALAVAAVVVVAEFWLLGTGFRLGPLGLGIAAALLTWPATIAYRTSARFAAVALTALVFGAVLWLSEPDVTSGGGWILLAAVLAAYAHMALLGTVDVLAPRPRSVR
jgi:hypothetical protein